MEIKHETYIEFPVEVDAEYVPAERPTLNYPGAPDEIIINGHSLRLSFGSFDLSEWYCIGEWLKRLKSAYRDVSSVGADEDKHWRAVGKLACTSKPWAQRGLKARGKLSIQASAG